MSVRNILLILAAVLITVGTGLVARSWINSQQPQLTADAPQPVPARKAYVLVAQSDLPVGTFVKESHLTWQAWPDDKLHSSYLVQDNFNPRDLVGAVVRRGITGGEPVTAGQLIKPGDRGFLAAVLRPGYRAVSVQVNATSAIAGLVFPGDRVDVLLTHSVARGESERKATETVLENVRILAIDQTIENTENAPRVGKNATLEVTPKQAEMLAVLSDLGRLSFALRSLAKDEEELQRIISSDAPLAEPDPTRGNTHTWDSEVSRLIWRPNSASQDVVEVTRGKEVQELRFNKRK